MSFDKEAKRFKCFSCGQSYDIFNHYQEHYNKPFIEAVKSIVSDFGMNIDININDSDRKLKKEPTKHENSNNNIFLFSQ